MHAGRNRRKSSGRHPTTDSRSASWTPIVRNLFGIDSRSLALFRVAMGALLLVDLAIRATDLNAMYTDHGMFPRGLIRHHFTSSWNWSFHFASGSWADQAVLFGVAAALALALLVGFQTRLAVIGSWLMLVSLHHRVPPINSGADNLLRMLLFWAMFLPLGRAWSLDRWLEKRRGRAAIRSDETQVLSVASAAILLQMALMYLFSGIFKFNTDWLSGEAIAGTLAHDFYGTPLGERLLQFPRLLAGLTWLTLALECGSPVLLFFPKYTARFRLGVVAALAAMHIGIWLLMMVDLFSPVALAGLTLFLPAEFWNSRLFARFSRPHEGAKDEAAAKVYVPKGPPLLRRAAQGLCAILMVYVIAVNINTLPSRPLAALAPQTWKPLATGCGLRQKWGMFSEVPSKDGWYVARAKLKDGAEVDLLRGGAPVDWTRPDFPAGIYPNHHWRKVFREMAYYDELGYQVFRAPVAKFLCRSWNGRHDADTQIAEFEFIYCIESHPNATSGSATQTIRERLVHLDFSRPVRGASDAPQKVRVP
jgi:hypothetical protein